MCAALPAPACCVSDTVPASCAQVGCVLQQQFHGQAAELVESSCQSAVRLVQLLAAHCPGFRDHAIYAGQQVCMCDYGPLLVVCFIT